MRFTRQAGLVRETARMAFETLRANKMRSALTVLGVVIGVTSIVGMTSLIRGFDTSLRDSIAALGPKTIFVQRFGAVSFSSGASFLDLIRRPGLTVDDGEAIRRLAPSVAIVDTWLGAGPPRPDHGAHVLPGRADAALCDHGHQRAVRRRELRQAARRPRLHRAGGGAAPPASR